MLHDTSLAFLHVSNLRGPLSLVEMISDWLRFKGNDTFIVRNEREVHIFPYADKAERLSQPIHQGDFQEKDMAESSKSRRKEA